MSLEFSSFNPWWLKDPKAKSANKIWFVNTMFKRLVTDVTSVTTIEKDTLEQFEQIQTGDTDASSTHTQSCLPARAFFFFHVYTTMKSIFLMMFIMPKTSNL